MALKAALTCLRGLRISYRAQAVGISCLPSVSSTSDCPERALINKRNSARVNQYSYSKPRLLHVLPTNVSQTLRCFSHGSESGTTSTLLEKKCTPCSSKDLQPLTKELAETLLEQVPGWTLVDVDGKLQLKKSLKTKNFVKGLDLMKEIGVIAESEGHHPDLHLVNWNQLEVNVSTHAIGGLSENDFILAAKIGALNMEGYLRKSAKNSAHRSLTEKQ